MFILFINYISFFKKSLFYFKKFFFEKFLSKIYIILIKMQLEPINYIVSCDKTNCLNSHHPIVTRIGKEI